MACILKILSWNVNGIRAAEQKGFSSWLMRESPDLLCLQEIKAFSGQIPKKILESEPYQCYWNPAKRPGYSGVGIMTKVRPEDVMYGMGQEEFDIEGRVLTLTFDDFYLVNIYFPNAQELLKRIDYKIAFNKSVQAFLKRLKKKKNVIVCGDYNVAHKEIDLARPKANENNAGFSLPERAWMDAFLADGYIDTFRIKCQESGHYSWWSYRARARENNIGWRIDYVCVNQKLKSHVQDAFILQDVLGSDHCPVGIHLKI